MLLDEIDARKAGKARRRPSPSSASTKYVEPKEVSERALAALMGELQLNGYVEGHEVYTDSDDAYQDSD